MPNLLSIEYLSSDFPSDVLKWMKENAKPKMALKLMKCQKCFQHSEFPYFVVKHVEYGIKRDNWFLKALNGEQLFYEGTQGIEIIEKQLWITQHLFLSSFSNLVTCIIPKIAICDIKYLILFDQQLSFDHFKFLTISGNVKVLQFRNTQISFENGDPIFIDSLLKCVPNLQKFDCFNTEIFPVTTDFCNFDKIDTSKLQTFHLTINSYQKFNVFLKFMDQHPHIDYEAEIISTSFSPDEIKAAKKLVQKIIDVEISKYPIPFFKFS